MNEQRVRQLVIEGHANTIAEVNRLREEAVSEVRNAITEVNRLREETIVEVSKSHQKSEDMNASIGAMSAQLTATSVEQAKLIEHVNLKKNESDAREERMRLSQSAAESWITTQTQSAIHTVNEIKAQMDERIQNMPK